MSAIESQILCKLDSVVAKTVDSSSGLEILYIWAAGLRAKKSLGAKNPRVREKEEKRSEKKREERSRKRGVKCGRNQKKYKSPTKPDSYLIFLALLQSTSIQSI